jgi:hypothetical protein
MAKTIRQILVADGFPIFREPVAPYGDDFDRENEALRLNNTAPWQTNLETQSVSLVRPPIPQKSIQIPPTACEKYRGRKLAISTSSACSGDELPRA